MKLRLKEKPIEWIKFTAVMAVLVMAVGYLLFRKRILSQEGLLVLGMFALGTVLLSVLRPRWFRPLYRAGMTVSWHVGQAMGRIMLLVFFFFIVTPMGLVLRLCGKDLLALRRKREGSYWRPASPATPFERLF